MGKSCDDALKITQNRFVSMIQAQHTHDSTNLIILLRLSKTFFYYYGVHKNAMLREMRMKECSIFIQLACRLKSLLYLCPLSLLV